MFIKSQNSYHVLADAHVQLTLSLSAGWRCIHVFRTRVSNSSVVQTDAQGCLGSNNILGTPTFSTFEVPTS